MFTKVPYLGHLIEVIIDQKVSKNKTPTKDILKGVISTLALFLFTYEPSKHTSGSSAGLTIGYLYLTFSLITDGLLSLKEKLVSKEVHENQEFAEYKSMVSWYTMFTLNIAVIAITIPVYSKTYFLISF